MSKRFGKHCRGNTARSHLGGAQPCSLVAAAQRGTPEPGVLLVIEGWLRAWGCSWPGVQGTSWAEAAPGHTELLSPAQSKPVEPCHCQGLRAKPRVMVLCKVSLELFARTTLPLLSYTTCFRTFLALPA